MPLWASGARYGIRASKASSPRSCRWYSAPVLDKHHQPLKILFCGADQFSIYSLRTLHELQQQHTDTIASIDVVCRPDKARGRRGISEVPIKRTALDLGLKLHQLDTFTDWTPPGPIGLIIAVSFGLLVPARLLNGATFGGLNVHPSLLPELRGAAPIQHALLQRSEKTGVTLQTMHPTRFDHGHVLDQVEADVPLNSRYEDLVQSLGPLGAKMLVRSIETGAFISPAGMPVADSHSSSYAPKITAEDSRVDWQRWTADDIALRERVLGKLWDETTYGHAIPSGADELPTRRTTFAGPWRILETQGLDLRTPSGYEAPFPGCPVAFWQMEGKWEHFAVFTSDRKLAVPARVFVQGEAKDAIRKMANMIANG